MIFGVFLGLSGFFNTIEDGKAHIDDLVFRLHYAFTSGVLFLASVLLGLQDFVGKSIDCHSQHMPPSKAVNQYCWITGTFLVLHADDPRGLGKGVRFKDEDCFPVGDSWFTDQGQECIQRHSYYQWVPYVLFIEGCMFYAPRMVWLWLEEGKMTSMSDGIRHGKLSMTSASMISSTGEGGVDDGGLDSKIRTMAKNVAAYIRMPEGGHTRYGVGYLTAQVLNAVNLGMSIWFLDAFLDGQFHDLGYRWTFCSDTACRDTLLYRLFPRKTRCHFKSFGRGGRISDASFLCVLAPNVISEKLFLLLWFWLFLLSIVTASNLLGLLLLCRTPSRGSSCTGVLVALRKAHLFSALWTSSSQPIKANDFLAQLTFGQYLFLYLLARNTQYSVYKRILEEVSRTYLPPVAQLPRTVKEERPASGNADRAPEPTTVAD